MRLENHFTLNRNDANFLYSTSYVYDLTDTKTETKEEIGFKIMNLESKVSLNMQ